MARLPVLTTDELPDDYQDLFDVDEDDPDDVNVKAHQVWANNPPLYAAWDEWAWGLYDAVDDPRRRELVILAVARELECRFVWHQHVPLAAHAGLTWDEIRSISVGDLAPFPPAEAILVEYATTVITGSVDDELHERLAAQYDASTIVSMLFLATEYAQIAAIIDALAISLDEEFVGWEPENTP